MDPDRFDHLTTTLGAPSSRRLALGGLLAALASTVGPLASIPALHAIRPDAAADGSTAIIGGGGGDGNRRRRNRPRHDRNRRNNDHRDRRRRDSEEPDSPPDPPPASPPPGPPPGPSCQPLSQSELCLGRCGLVLDDGCGGQVACTCESGTACAASAGVCCLSERLCGGQSICCPPGEVCADLAMDAVPESASASQVAPAARPVSFALVVAGSAACQRRSASSAVSRMPVALRRCNASTESVYSSAGLGCRPWFCEGATRTPDRERSWSPAQHLLGSLKKLVAGSPPFPYAHRENPGQVRRKICCLTRATAVSQISVRPYQRHQSIARP